jgi:hypothetical protein
VSEVDLDALADVDLDRLLGADTDETSAERASEPVEVAEKR